MAQFKVVFVLVLAIKLLAAHQHSESASCPFQCSCSPAPTTVTCRSNISHPIENLPQSFPLYTVQVFLNNNQISVIPQDSLSRVGSSLILLSIKSNNIHRISRGAFQSLENLHLLYLENNSISILRKNMFTGLNKLQYLDLDDNMVQDVQCSTFSSMYQLRYLGLSENSLRHISRCMFRGLGNLTTLDVSNNKIADISIRSFVDLRKLRELKLNNNLITAFNALWFAHRRLTNLLRLRLSGNPWSCSCGVKEHFATFSSNKEINCEGDNMCLMCYSPPALRLQAISEVNTSHWNQNCHSIEQNQTVNQLSVDPAPTETQQKIHFEIPHSQHAIQIRSAIQSSPDNTGNCTGDALLSNIQCVNTYCYLLPGNVTIVCKNFIPVTVENLLLSSNRFTSINTTDLQGLYNLTSLTVSDNLISVIEDFSFVDQARLSDLNLDGNRITSINQNTFSGLSSLRDLNFRTNLIAGVLETGLFQHLTSLAMLDLGFNRITELEDCVFCNTTEMMHLDLSYNLITTISRNAFQGLTRFQQLDISNNMITAFDFTALANFLVLSGFRTENNDWACTCNLYHEYHTFISVRNITATCDPVVDSLLCVSCALPQSLSGQELYNLDEDNITDCRIATTMAATTTFPTSETSTNESTSTTATPPTTAISTSLSTTTTQQETTGSVEVTETTTLPVRPTEPEAVVDGENINRSLNILPILLAVLIPAGIILVVTIIALIYSSKSTNYTSSKNPHSQLGTAGNFSANNDERQPAEGRSGSAEFEMAPVNVFDEN